MRSLIVSAFSLLLLTPACAEVPTPRDGEVPTPDAGPVPPDAGPTPDAGPVPPDADAGPTPDAGPVPPDADAGPTPDAPPDATIPELDLGTEEGFARARARMICQAWALCGRCDAPTPTCEETMTEQFLHPTVAYPGTYHPEDAAAYLGLLEDTYADCEKPSVAEHHSLTPFHGEQEDGTLCTSASQCQSAHCAAVNVADPWTCFIPTFDSGVRSPLCR